MKCLAAKSRLSNRTCLNQPKATNAKLVITRVKTMGQKTNRIRSGKCKYDEYDKKLASAQNQGFSCITSLSSVKQNMLSKDILDIHVSQ